MRNYVASVAVDAQGQTGVITAPYGGIAVIVDVVSGRFVGQRALDNVFGVAAKTCPGNDGSDKPGGDSFVLSSGNGLVASFAASAEAGLQPLPQSLAAAWDNHLAAIG